ncbi:hypothetical protein ACK8OR_01810 [Jannaschia sp. KMU-145]|uniref:hypothetical protein n=1 Tax=Jannaschia halovivens TaxID=3388667 RepID=UPI00396B2BFE
MEGAKATTVKSSAHHLDREAGVAARIEYLRREIQGQIELPDLDGPAIAKLMDEVTDSLELAHAAASAAAASESDLTKIRARLTIHIGRMGIGQHDDDSTDGPAHPMRLIGYCEC